MQWIPGPEPQGDNTEEMVATPGLFAANAAPLTPGRSEGSTSGRAVSGADARMPPVALLSRTSTTAPGRTHKVSPLSALVIVTPVREQSRGLGDASGLCGAAGEGAAGGEGMAAGDGEAVSDGEAEARIGVGEAGVAGEAVRDGDACADEGTAGLAAITESSAGAVGRCPHPVSIKAIAATPASFATRIRISPPVPSVR